MLDGQKKIERQLLLAQEDKQQRNADTATKLKQILDLQKELEIVG